MYTKYQQNRLALRQAAIFFKKPISTIRRWVTQGKIDLKLAGHWINNPKSISPAERERRRHNLPRLRRMANGVLYLNQFDKEPKIIERKQASRTELLQRYNLTAEQHDAQYEKQNGLCALCGFLPELDQCLAIDHDHKTQEVRGLLCFRCNIAMERVDNCIGWTRKAERYIATHKQK